MPTDVQPRFVEQVSNVYIFEAVTSLAYVPVHVTECYAYDSSGQKHDLSPLIHDGSGWRVVTKDSSNKYFINVCRSVGHLNTSSCSRESSLYCSSVSCITFFRENYLLELIVIALSFEKQLGNRAALLTLSVHIVRNLHRTSNALNIAEIKRLEGVSTIESHFHWSIYLSFNGQTICHRR